MLLMASTLAATLYWNDQLSFGVSLPSNFPHCLGVSDAPDRGVYVLLRRHEKCPDLSKEGIFEYIERKKIPAIGIVAWYNTIEEFNGSEKLAEQYCSGGRVLQKRNFKYGEVYYCFVVKNKKTSLHGFVQLHAGSVERETVNIEFYLNRFEGKYAREYWAVVESVVLSR